MLSINLRPISQEDTDNIVRWRNSDAVRKNLFSQADATREGHLRWLETMVKTGKCHQFIIELDGRAVGTAFLKNADYENKKAEFGIFIGEADCRGKGVGQKATELVIDYGFSAMGLNRIYLSVFSDNVAAIKVYKKAGFLIEGELKEDICRNGEFYDVTLMAILKKNQGVKKPLGCSAD